VDHRAEVFVESEREKSDEVDQLISVKSAVTWGAMVGVRGGSYKTAPEIASCVAPIPPSSSFAWKKRGGRGPLE